MSARTGEIACLAAAALWAVAVMVFRPAIEAHGARVINLVKCALATLLLGLTAWWFGGLGEIATLPRLEFWLIVVSGVVGLGVGDTALFAAVAKLGPYRTLLFQNLAPVFTAAIALLWWGQAPSGVQSLGAVVTLVGITLVIRPSNGATAGGVSWAGVGFAVLSAFGQGAGIALAARGMVGISTLPAAFLRLAAATLGVALLTGFGIRGIRRVRGVLQDRAAVPRVVFATLIGTYLAFILMTAGIKLAPPAVAAVLLSTTPVFSLFLDAWKYGERISARAVVGVTLALAGVAGMTLG